MRKVCVITGTRADYGILYPVMKAIASTKGLYLQVIATSMHLMKEFGYTIKEMKKDGLKIDVKVDVSYQNDTGLAMADSFGRAVAGLAKAFNRICPDVIVILGDRGEMLAAAIAASYLNISVAHIHGGEVSGHLDGIFRHAITKLSHIHFPATKKAGERILKLGEDPQKVFVSGAPAVDNILKERLPDKASLFKKYRLSSQEPVFLVIQHPVSGRMEKNKKHMKITMDAVKGFKAQSIIIYPNADAGGREIIKVIKRYKGHNRMKIFKSIPYRDYLGLLKHASVLIGNSSSGIIEAPLFGLPVVNIGDRQDGRERCFNVINVPYDKASITKAVKQALYDKRFIDQARRRLNIYGDGRASERIAKILKTIRLDDGLLKKQITY